MNLRSFARRGALCVLIGLCCLSLLPAFADSFEPTFEEISASSDYKMSMSLAQLTSNNAESLNPQAVLRSEFDFLPASESSPDYNTVVASYPALVTVSWSADEMNTLRNLTTLNNKGWNIYMLYDAASDDPARAAAEKECAAQAADFASRSPDTVVTLREEDGLQIVQITCDLYSPVDNGLMSRHDEYYVYRSIPGGPKGLVLRFHLTLRQSDPDAGTNGSLDLAKYDPDWNVTRTAVAAIFSDLRQATFSWGTPYYALDDYSIGTDTPAGTEAQTPGDSEPVTGPDTEPGTSALIEDGTTQDARETDGETAVPVAAAIVVGLLSAAAAVAVGAAASSGSAAAAAAAGADEAAPASAGDEPERSYVMYVGKDFGDAVRRGAPPVTVTARMAERGPSGETDRPDLTAAITVSGGHGMTVESAGMSGNAMTAAVAVPENAGKKADVTFTFHGEGGTYRNTVVFRTVGEPHLCFPDLSRGNEAFIDVIAGDGGTYRVRMFFEDAVRDPVRVTFASGHFDVTAEPEENGLWQAVIVNRTEPLPAGLSAFTAAQNQGESIAVRAEFENGDVAEGSIRVMLHPEGLSFTAPEVVDGRLAVNTANDKKTAEFSYKIRPTRFDAFAAYLENGRPVFADLGKAEFSFGELTGRESYSDDLSRTFDFHVDAKRSDEGILTFVPEATLPQPGRPYLAELPVSVTIGSERFENQLPLILYGETPERSDDRDKELELLKRAVARYGLSDSRELRTTLRGAKSLTANELRMLRRAILEEACSYYTREANLFASLGDKLERYEFVASSLKFLGDQAFAYLVTVYGGGPAVEAFASPLKDMFAEFAGTYAGALLAGETVEYESSALWSAISQGIESTLYGVISGSEKPTPQKIGYAVAGFMMFSFVRHYYTGEAEKGDLFKSLVAAGSDLSVNFFKDCVGDAFGKYLKSDRAFAQRIGKYLTSQFDPNLPEVVPADVLSKYVSETLGLVGATVYDAAAGTVGGTVRFDEEDLVLGAFGCEIRFNLFGNLAAIAERFSASVFAPFTALSRPVPVRDCEKYYK